MDKELREMLRNKLAACKFLETGPELGNNYTEVIAAQDVVTYGGLCALASFGRTELKNTCSSNASIQHLHQFVHEVHSRCNSDKEYCNSVVLVVRNLCFC